MFKHFIVTPFNVDLGLKARRELLDPDYLSRRFQLFQEFCFPSVYHQTNQNFCWLVFFDWQTPDEFKEKVKKWQKWTNFIPILTQEKLDFQPFLIKIIQQNLSFDTTHIITTWLDGDDALAKIFIDKVQQQFNHQDFEYINFPYGYQLDRTGLYLRQYLSSQFISLIEKVEHNILTCKVMSHHDLYRLSKKGLPVRQVLTEPMWIQLIHENNIYTSLHLITLPQSRRRLNKKFEVQAFVRNYIRFSYYHRVYYYLNHLRHQFSQTSTRHTLRHLLALIEPSILQFFLSKALQVQRLEMPHHQLSIAEIKTLCLKQKTIWRRSQSHNVVLEQLTDLPQKEEASTQPDKAPEEQPHKP